jgi:hypothetical protein
MIAKIFFCAETFGTYAVKGLRQEQSLRQTRQHERLAWLMWLRRHRPGVRGVWQA